MVFRGLRHAALTLPIVFLAMRPQAPSPRLPFLVGERLTYDAKVNAINAGKASLSVEGLETVRGVGTFHTIFDLRGRVLFKKFENHYESWFDTTSLVTMRLLQDADVDKHYEFSPATKIYVKTNDGWSIERIALA